MANIFWIAEKDGASMEIFAFNNKRKAQEKAMELSSDFSFGDTEVPKDGDEDGDEWLYSGMINAKECFLLYREDGMPYAEGFDSEDEAREEYPGDAAGACFPVKIKGGMGSVYMSMEAEANGTELWTFEDGEIYEAKQTTMKYIPTFESFVNEYSTIVETKKMIKALKKAIKAADSFDAIGTELDDLDYREKYQWELVEDGSRFSSNNYDGKYPVYVITYLAGSRHAIADPKFWKNSAEIEEQVGDVAIGWITGK